MSDKEDEDLPKANANASKIAIEIEPNVQVSPEINKDNGSQSILQSDQTSLSETEELLDLDRTALGAILDVSCRLKDFQSRSRTSMSTLAQAHESYKDKQVNKQNN